MSSWLTTSGSVWKFNGSVLIRDTDPYNPLGLPSHTMRLSFSDSSYDPIEAGEQSEYSWAAGSTWTKVSGGANENIWDFRLDSDNWSNPFVPFWDLYVSPGVASCYVTVLGANLTGVTNMQGMLGGFNAVVETALFDTSSATDVSSMFASSLITSVPQYPLANCTNTSAMFHSASRLVTVPTLDLSSSTAGSGMFYGCKSLVEAPMLIGPKFDNWYNMFMYCTNLRSVPAYDLSYGREFENAFGMCTSLEEIPDFTFGNSVVNTEQMFYGDRNVGVGILRAYNKLSAIPSLVSGNHELTFYNCGADSITGLQELREIPKSWGGLYDPYNPLDLPPYTIRCKFPADFDPSGIGQSRTLVESGEGYKVWDITQESNSWRSLFGQYAGDLLEVLGANSTGVTDMGFLFDGALHLTTVPLFDTSSVESMAAMFRGVPELGDQGSSLVTVPLFDTGRVTDFGSMFQGAVSLTSLPTFNTYAARDLRYMMAGCKSLRAVPWFHTDTVENMAFMCAGCQSILEIPLLTTGTVTNMQSAFHGCSAVRTGALALYQQASGQAHPPRNHVQTFADCGSGNPAGVAELAEIPSDWK